MIVPIVLFIVFFLSAGILTVFLFSILIPAIRRINEETVNENFLLNKNEFKMAEDKTVHLKDSGMRAVVLCNHEKIGGAGSIAYSGPKDCRIYFSQFETNSDCFQQCLGFGSCVSVCPQKAIKLVNETAVIQDGCIGCGACVDLCPKKIIKLVPVAEVVRIIPCGNTVGETACTGYKSERKEEIPQKQTSKLAKVCYNMFNKN